MTPSSILWIGLGGAIGAIARAWIAQLLSHVPFPLGTLVVNLAGSFLIGLLAVLVTDRDAMSPVRAFLGLGLLGGFTTFSGYAMETWTLLQQGRVLDGVLNIALQNGLSLLLAGLGIAAGVAVRSLWFSKG
jgi:CrcB protein